MFTFMATTRNGNVIPLRDTGHAYAVLLQTIEGSAHGWPTSAIRTLRTGLKTTYGQWITPKGIELLITAATKEPK